MSLSRRRVGRALSPREREVLHLLWDGLQTKEIAARLGLAPHWIKNIRFTIGLKLGVHTTMAMVRAGLAQGILKLPGCDGETLSGAAGLGADCEGAR